MSEQAPRSNSRLENFDANKAAKEREEFEGAVYGEAGTTDFSDEARKRVEEADAYERHMEKLAEEKRLDYDRGLDRLESGEAESAAYNREWDDAAAENEAFDAARKAEAEAFEEKFAKNPSLRQMDRISKEIHELRSKEVTPDTVDQDTRRLGELDDRLQELLEKYSGSEGYDPAVADFLMDRDDKSGLDRGAKDLLEKREVKAPRTPEDFKASDSPEQMAADVAELINNEKDPVIRAAAVEKARDIVRQLEEALAPDVSSLDDNLGDSEPKPAKLDTNDHSSDDNLGDEEPLPRILTPDTPDSDDGLGDHEAKSNDLDDGLGDEKPEVRVLGGDSKWHKRALSRLYSLCNRAGAEAAMLPERYRSAKGTTKVTIGVVAIAAIGVAAYATWKLGGGGGGGGGGTKEATAALPNTDGAPKVSMIDILPQYKGGYPWDWAKGVFGEGDAMNKLHELASKAAADGHNVQWHGSGTHEWVSIDGSSDSKRVVDILSGYGSK